MHESRDSPLFLVLYTHSRMNEAVGPRWEFHYMSLNFYACETRNDFYSH